MFPKRLIWIWGVEEEREKAERGLLFWNVALKFDHMGTRVSILGFVCVV